MEPYLGQIMLVPYNFEPRGWAFCNGQLLSIAQYTALFSLLGTTYGGNGQTTFALPDLRGRVPVSSGQGPGLSDYTLGEMAGQESVTLTSSQMPMHTHLAALNASTTLNEGSDTPNAQSVLGPSNDTAAGAEVKIYSNSSPNQPLASNSVTVQPAGGSQPFDNRPPYLTMNYVIALEGIFPSRN
jgi:microcystin-dependent protein